MCSAVCRRSGLRASRGSGARCGSLTVVASAAAVAAFGFGSGGCVDNEQSIFIRQVVAPAEGECTFSADATQLAIARGTLDLGLRSAYEATMLVGSQLVQRGSKSQLRDETSRVALEGSEVYAVDGSGNVVFGPFSVAGSGFIDPSDGTTPAYGLLASVLLKADAGSALRDLVVNGNNYRPVITSHVKAFGHTLGGMKVESGEYLFPINVCYGCLVTFPSEASTSSAVANCDKPVDTGTTLPSVCAFGQDDQVDCRVCKEQLGSRPICEPH